MTIRQSMRESCALFQNSGFTRTGSLVVERAATIMAKERNHGEAEGMGTLPVALSKEYCALLNSATAFK